MFLSFSSLRQFGGHATDQLLRLSLSTLPHTGKNKYSANCTTPSTLHKADEADEADKVSGSKDDNLESRVYLLVLLSYPTLLETHVALSPEYSLKRTPCL